MIVTYLMFTALLVCVFTICQFVCFARINVGMTLILTVFHISAPLSILPQQACALVVGEALYQLSRCAFHARRAIARQDQNKQVEEQVEDVAPQPGLEMAVMRMLEEQDHSRASASGASSAVSGLSSSHGNQGASAQHARVDGL
jgi:hypothetical protein